MLLKDKNPRIILGLGQICMFLGLVGSHFLRVYAVERPLTFFLGFAHGLTGAFLGVSIVLHIVGIFAIRRLRKHSVS